MPPNRLDQRRARTRAALLGAARDLLVSRAPAEVSIQEITEAADVGFGSFYNHFESKQALFDQAIAQVAAEHQELLDAATAGLTDPAEVLSAAVRLTVRLPRTHPHLARVIDRAGLAYLEPLAPVVVRFLRHAHNVGRLCFDDGGVALSCLGGATLGALRHTLTVAAPDADLSETDQAARQAALGLLRLFGVPEIDARRIAARPLPAPVTD
ncbi:TetR/AcrR family transcriptional regulator [Actinoplanes sp. NPDC023936]|uniref:TetR/AcrR family transcriptional regulator n=1 Tax=Actinoplanes sp. NPDC023936 TaxID=3154910 RepID=UPI0033DC7A3A